MKTKVFILLFWALSPGFVSLFAQSEIQLQSIECYNLGDGRYYCRYRAFDKEAPDKPVQGTARIIDGYTTQYIDATFDDGIPHGSWKTYRQNKLVEEYNYKKGLLDGEGKEYYADGSVKSVRNYVNGKPHGKFTDYDSKGGVTHETNFKDGEQDGPEIKYDSDGKVTSQTIYSAGKPTGAKTQIFNDYTLTANYDSKGDFDGEYAEIFSNGNVKSKGTYVHGKKEGVWETGRKDGKKMATEEYKAGDKVKETAYYTDNTVEVVREMKNGKKNGWERKYKYGDGSLTSELFYKDGEVSSSTGTGDSNQPGKPGLVKQTKQMSSNMGNFIQTFYQLNGRYEGEYTEQYVEGNAMKTKGQYTDGKKEGTWVYETQQGEKEQEENYSAGKLNGLLTKYTDGVIRESTEYRDDTPNGEHKQYNADGKLILKGAFEDGKRHGAIEEYYPSGKIREKNNYSKGSYDGVRQTFYTNGQMQQEETYVNGRQIGPYKRWAENGQLLIEGESARSGSVFQKTYENGKLYMHEYRDEDGVKKVDYYDKDGKKK
jgi:antitoxin component YwqK of YwqJK toxin-antitoxin module